MRHYLGILCAIFVLLAPWFAINHPQEFAGILSGVRSIGDQLAAAVMHNPKTIADIKATYNSKPQTSFFSTTPAKKVRILLVPGHEPGYGGAEFGSLKERDMNVELAHDLKQILEQNGRYQTFVTRDDTSWDPTFASYFKDQWSAIADWEQAHKAEIIDLSRIGDFHPLTHEVLHISVPDDVARRIYGINKWVDENNIDIVIHIHFNDYPTHPRGQAGKYTGFAIYVPEKQYANSTTTVALAGKIFDRLNKYNAVSDFPGEADGIVEDQDLIAVGAYNSVDAASMLLEYGYIYEPQFVDPTLRSQALKDLAFQTYLGLQDFFDQYSVASMSGAFGTLMMPHIWKTADVHASSTEVYALQTALLLDGVYPPQGYSLSDCPRTGKIGPCTKQAIDAFQKKHGIDDTGSLNDKTVQELNRLYGSQTI